MLSMDSQGDETDSLAQDSRHEAVVLFRMSLILVPLALVSYILMVWRYPDAVAPFVLLEMIIAWSLLAACLAFIAVPLVVYWQGGNKQHFPWFALIVPVAVLAFSLWYLAQPYSILSGFSYLLFLLPVLAVLMAIFIVSYPRAPFRSIVLLLWVVILQPVFLLVALFLPRILQVIMSERVVRDPWLTLLYPVYDLEEVGHLPPAHLGLYVALAFATSAFIWFRVRREGMLRKTIALGGALVISATTIFLFIAMWFSVTSTVISQKFCPIYYNTISLAPTIFGLFVAAVAVVIAIWLLMMWVANNREGEARPMPIVRIAVAVGAIFLLSVLPLLFGNVLKTENVGNQEDYLPMQMGYKYNDFRCGSVMR